VKARGELEGILVRLTARRCRYFQAQGKNPYLIPRIIPGIGSRKRVGKKEEQVLGLRAESLQNGGGRGTGAGKRIQAKKEALTRLLPIAGTIEATSGNDNTALADLLQIGGVKGEGKEKSPIPVLSTSGTLPRRGTVKATKTDRKNRKVTVERSLTLPHGKDRNSDGTQCPKNLLPKTLGR